MIPMSKKLFNQGRVRAASNSTMPTKRVVLIHKRVKYPRYFKKANEK